MNICLKWYNLNQFKWREVFRLPFGIWSMDKNKNNFLFTGNFVYTKWVLGILLTVWRSLYQTAQTFTNHQIPPFDQGPFVSVLNPDCCPLLSLLNAQETPLKLHIDSYSSAAGPDGSPERVLQESVIPKCWLISSSTDHRRLEGKRVAVIQFYNYSTRAWDRVSLILWLP